LVALRFDPEAQTLYALDQTALPFEERELQLRSADEVAEAIRRLAIRGAPLIGVAAAYGVALDAAADPTPAALARACETLTGSRPTAVNLARAVERVRREAEDRWIALAFSVPPSERAGIRGWDTSDALRRRLETVEKESTARPTAYVGPQGPPSGLRAGALAQAIAIEAEEEAASAAMARHGADFLAGTQRILTHCNTGALAAPGRGTALAVIAELHDRGDLEEVIATEARPLLQGARLTTYELGKLGIRHALIVDSAAAGLLAAGAAQAVVLGADRIAANGDVANKVGTYALALAARAAEVPFVVVAPTSTVDPDTPTGADIVIEERARRPAIRPSMSPRPSSSPRWSPSAAWSGRRARTRWLSRAPEGQILADAPRVADGLTVDDEHGNPRLARQRDDLVAARAALGHVDLVERDVLLAQPAGDRAARTQPVGGRRAAGGRPPAPARRRRARDTRRPSPLGSPREVMGASRAPAAPWRW
jgi:methylthioribose-1-phosphate isomerase